MLKFTVRKANLSDLAQVSHLFDQYRQFYQQKHDIFLAEKFIEERLKNQESVILIAEQDGDLLGFCQLYPTFCSVEAAYIATLYDLFVSEDVRNKGVARALMMAATEYAKENHFVRLDLSTAKTNAPAQALYESLGWQRDNCFYQYSIAIK
jgi:ribosomal protein S18 acetylase RimI-like enzyme